MTAELPVWVVLLIIFIGCSATFFVGYKLGVERGIKFAKESRKRAIDMLFPPIKNKE